MASCGASSFGVGTGGVFVIAVGAEQYKVPIESALLATTARRMMVGAEARKIVVGQLDRGDGTINSPHQWHIKSGTVSFSADAIPACDGLPSQIDADIPKWVDTIKQYCPTAGRIISEVGK